MNGMIVLETVGNMRLPSSVKGHMQIIVVVLRKLLQIVYIKAD